MNDFSTIPNMAAENKPTLDRALHTLIYGPVHARVNPLPPEYPNNDFDFYFFRRVKTPPKTEDPSDSGKFVVEMSAKRRVELRGEVFAVYNQLLVNADAASVDEPNRYYEYSAFNLYSDDLGNVRLNIRRGSRRRIVLHFNANAPYYDDPVQKALIILSEKQLPEVHRDRSAILKRYSPTEDLMALAAVAAASSGQQWSTIVDDDNDHLLSGKLW